MRHTEALRMMLKVVAVAAENAGPREAGAAVGIAYAAALEASSAHQLAVDQHQLADMWVKSLSREINILGKERDSALAAIKTVEHLLIR